jgi:hypothetical protein
MRRKIGPIIVTLAGVGAIVGFAYRGPISEIGNAFKREVQYYFSINADSALEGKIGNKDIDAMANQLEGINDDVEAPDWKMETATGEVFDVFLDRFTFLREAGDWVKGTVFKESSSDGVSETQTDNSDSSEE